MRAEEAKTTLRLDFDVHKRLRVLSLEKNTTFGALVDQALREFLERETRKGKRKGGTK